MAPQYKGLMSAANSLPTGCSRCGGSLTLGVDPMTETYPDGEPVHDRCLTPAEVVESIQQEANLLDWRQRNYERVAKLRCG